MSKAMQDMIETLLEMDESTRALLIEQGLENINATLNKEELLQIKEMFQPSKPQAELHFGHPVGGGIRESKDKQEDAEIKKLEQDMEIASRSMDIAGKAIGCSLQSKPNRMSKFLELENVENIFTNKKFPKDFIDAYKKFRTKSILTNNLSPKDFFDSFEKRFMATQFEWMKLKLGVFKPDVLVVAFGSQEGAVEKSFQSYPLYARDLSDMGKKVLIIDIDIDIDMNFNATQVKPKDNVNIFCFRGNFNFADALKKFLEETPKDCPIVFHSYHSSLVTAHSPTTNSPFNAI